MSIESWYPEELRRPAIEREGVRLEIPRGWEGRIARQEDGGDGRAFNVLHASTVPLSGQRADYGGGVVETLGPDDVFVALIEFGPEEANTALFKEVDRIPTLKPPMFHRNQLQRRIRGQAGVQHFFTLAGRPFCLYVVLGSIARVGSLVAKANELIDGMAVTSE